ncbi:MAG: hypothetical protein R2867_01550 [Caldilineaceae bacterium]
MAEVSHSPTTRIFALDQLRLVLSTPTPALTAQIATLWCDSFFLTYADVATVADRPTIHVLFQQSATAPRPTVAVPPVYQAGDLIVHKLAIGFLLRCGESWLALHIDEQWAEGQLAPDFVATRPQDQRDFFLLLLLMLGHRQGYYGLHANALSDGQRDYLVIGPSGSGKSTLTVRLLTQGWRCGGDDLLLLCEACGVKRELRLLALRRDFALSAQTLAYCRPAVGALHSVPTATEKQIVAGTTLTSLLQDEFAPALLLFAGIVDQAVSAVAPLDPRLALIALAQQSAGIMTDRAVAQLQMDLLARLCQQVPSYRLALGEDVFANPAQVAALLQGLCFD